MKIDINKTCELLRSADNIMILTHAKPDGDTIGSAFALWRALELLGKKARVKCPDPLPTRYKILYEEYIDCKFDPEFVVSVDVAGVSLLGKLAEKYENKVNLCIDHHHSNSLYAEHSFIDNSPAAAQTVYHVIKTLGVTPDKLIANALYIGIVTDTGGFRYAGVTPETHRIAADLLECGAEFSEINRMVFETKSRGRIAVESLLLQSMSFHFDGICACATLPGDFRERFTVSDDDLEGISGLTRSVDGVIAGITIVEGISGKCRVSFRSFDPVDASAICAELGGGGHKGAAGCVVEGTIEDVKAKVLGATQKELERKGLCVESS